MKVERIQAILTGASVTIGVIVTVSILSTMPQLFCAIFLGVTLSLVIKDKQIRANKWLDEKAGANELAVAFMLGLILPILATIASPFWLIQNIINFFRALDA